MTVLVTGIYCFVVYFMAMYCLEVSTNRRYLACRFPTLYGTEEKMKVLNRLRVHDSSVGSEMPARQVGVLTALCIIMGVLIAALMGSIVNAWDVYSHAQVTGYAAAIEAARLQVIFHAGVFGCYLLSLFLTLWFMSLSERATTRE